MCIRDRVEGVAFRVLAKVVGIDDGRFGLAIDGVVDVLAVAQAGHALRVLLAVAVVLVLQAQQRLVLPAGQVELAVQLGLGDAVVPFEAALAVKARDLIADQSRRLGAVAVQRALAVMAGQAQFPGFVQVVFETDLQ